VDTVTSNHTHSCKTECVSPLAHRSIPNQKRFGAATTTSTYSNLPPYMNVIYGQRKDPVASTSLGSEEEFSSGGVEK
jgi:hypothetical protein